MLRQVQQNIFLLSVAMLALAETLYKSIHFLYLKRKRSFLELLACIFLTVPISCIIGDVHLDGCVLIIDKETNHSDMSVEELKAMHAARTVIVGQSR